MRLPAAARTFLALFLFVLCGSGLYRLPAAEAEASAAATSGLRSAFGEFYAPTHLAVDPKAPQYLLPLDLSTVCNIDQVDGRLQAPEARAALTANGFVVVDDGVGDDMLEVYQRARMLGVPVFVTVDTVLHLYHVQFDETLRAIEERKFCADMAEFSRKMLRESLALHEDTLAGEGTEAIEEAARRNAGYFAVALKCLDPQAEVPAIVGDEVATELRLIEAHAGFSRSPLFVYEEDYSQYIPRGHYTRSEALQRYFKALMWYGRICMLLKGRSEDGLIPDEDARIQTLQACLIASTLHEPRNADLLQTWERVYTVTAFYVGFADDLTPAEYHRALAKVAGAAEGWARTLGADGLFALRSELATYRSPAIFGGTGNPIVESPFSPEQLGRLLSATQGMRLMGQRFIPDGYMMQRFINPGVGVYTGDGAPFTLGGGLRAFSRGLDVMAVLGSQRAYDTLTAEGDTAYEEYDQRLAALRDEFTSLGAADWNCNLYYGWLYSLQGLLGEFGAGYPSFMRSEAYADRLLWATLASWAELRHDTILYAKQPYAGMGMGFGAGGPRPPGYVEPVPEFYGRLLSLARMTRSGLGAMDVLDDAAAARLQALEEIIADLLRLSQTELRGEALSPEDAEYIQEVGSRLNACVDGLGAGAIKTTLVADVMTDGFSGQCVEEGVGNVMTMLAAYKLPDGRIAVGMGPVLSYYEFKHPMSDRLTDEKWRTEVLVKSPPPRPGWTASFFGGEAEAPAPRVPGMSGMPGGMPAPWQVPGGR